MATIDMNEIKKEKLRATNIVEFSAFALGESMKHKDKNIFKTLNAKNYIRVKSSTTGEENLALTIKPYLNKDGEQLKSVVRFGSNEINEWSYYFESDMDRTTGEVPENKVKWLPINAADFMTALKETTSKSFDTVVAMLGISMAATLELNKDNFEGYQESLISIGAFKEASTFAVEKGYKALSEDDFEEQSMITVVFSAIVAYMVAVAKDNGTPDRENSIEMPFAGIPDFMSGKTPKTALYKGMSQFGKNTNMLNALWASANAKGKK